MRVMGVYKSTDAGAHWALALSGHGIDKLVIVFVAQFYALRHRVQQRCSKELRWRIVRNPGQQRIALRRGFCQRVVDLTNADIVAAAIEYGDSDEPALNIFKSTSGGTQ
jgi:hypothetical protein